MTSFKIHNQKGKMAKENKSALIEVITPDGKFEFNVDVVYTWLTMGMLTLSSFETSRYAPVGTSQYK